MNAFGTLAYEFPDYDASTLPTIPPGFEPAHWHNEACPHWERAVDDGSSPYLSLWIDFPDPAHREVAGPRYLLLWNSAPTNDRSLCLEHTDDWAAILDVLEHLEARIIAARWVDRIGIGFHIDTRGADYTFQKTGRRVLNNVLAAEYDADMERLFRLVDDPYEQGLKVMRALAIGAP